MKIVKLLPLLLLIWGGSSTPAKAADGSYRFLSVSLAAAAKSKHKRRVAVLGFASETGKPSRSCAIVTARLTTEMASRPGLEVIERGRLDVLLRGRRLNSNGVVDAAMAKKIRETLGADAVVTGTVIELEDRKIEVNARLVDMQNGRILKAVTATIRKNWKEEKPGGWGNFSFDMDIDLDSPEELLEADPEEKEPCQRLSDDAIAFAKLCVDLRARKTALDMKTGALQLRKVTKHPGSEIRDPGLKQLYYARIKEWYYSDQLKELTPQEAVQVEKSSSLLEKYPCQ